MGASSHLIRDISLEIEEKQRLIIRADSKQAVEKISGLGLEASSEGGMRLTASVPRGPPSWQFDPLEMS